VGQPGSGQVSGARFKGVQHLGGGIVHGPFDRPAFALRKLADKAVLGPGSNLVSVKVISGGAVAGRNLENTGLFRAGDISTISTGLSG
jgi:hypothetical protein